MTTVIFFANSKSSLLSGSSALLELESLLCPVDGWVDATGLRSKPAMNPLLWLCADGFALSTLASAPHFESRVGCSVLLVTAGGIGSASVLRFAFGAWGLLLGVLSSEDSVVEAAWRTTVGLRECAFETALRTIVDLSRRVVFWAKDR